MTPRQTMLADRAQRQVLRAPGFTPMLRKPRGYIGKWDPSGEWRSLYRPKLCPAWKNRRTGKPHLHERAKARRLRQAAA